MADEEVVLYDGCGLEFEESELNSDGLCSVCAEDFEDEDEEEDELDG